MRDDGYRTGFMEMMDAVLQDGILGSGTYVTRMHGIGIPILVLGLQSASIPLNQPTMTSP